MRRKGISQGDVARLAKVSPTAVSLVLNGKQDTHRIAPETVQRIHEAMAELRYRPNALAQALVYGRTNTIGVVLGKADVTYLTNPYYGPALQGIVGHAFAQRRFVLLYHGGELTDADMDATTYLDGRCDGLILTPPFSSEKITAPLIELGFPFVTLGDARENPSVPSVDIDNLAAGEEVGSYLLRQGHRHILALAGHYYTQSTLRRLAGLRQAVERSGGTYEEETFPDETLLNRERLLLETLQGYLNRTTDNRPTALFCLTDAIALPVIRLLREIGHEVPRDISVMGFDDIPAAANAHLTTVRQDPLRLGEEAARLLLNLISRLSHEEESGSIKICIPTTLVERESVARRDA